MGGRRAWTACSVDLGVVGTAAGAGSVSAAVRSPSVSGGTCSFRLAFKKAFVSSRVSVFSLGPRFRVAQAEATRNGPSHSLVGNSAKS